MRIYCEHCGKIIRKDDSYYELNGNHICINCALDYLDEECKREDEDGEYYAVNGDAYELDEIASLLNKCYEENDMDEYDEDVDPRDEYEYWKYEKKYEKEI